jgi:hypothetical protein
MSTEEMADTIVLGVGAGMDPHLLSWYPTVLVWLISIRRDGPFRCIVGLPERRASRHGLVWNR